MADKSSGSFQCRPTGGDGFEYFCGFIRGEANQGYPSLYEDTTPIEPKKTPDEGYNLVEDMTDKALAWIGQQKALTPDKPFFVYFAPGAKLSIIWSNPGMRFRSRWHGSERQ